MNGEGDEGLAGIILVGAASPHIGRLSSQEVAGETSGILHQRAQAK